MDPDLNKYDLNHRVTHHPLMSDGEWEKLYFDSWRQYYTDEHVETILRREAARGGRIKALHSSMVHFLGSILIEKVHPLETGILRRRVRRQRRSGLPIENPLVFYPRRLFEIARTAVRWAYLYLRFKAVYDRVAKDQNAKDYIDLSLMSTSDEEQLDLDIIQTFKDTIPNTHGAPTGL
jgi:hypothetical protein